MNFDEYAAQDGLGLAALIAAGEISADEAAACAHAAIEAKNPELNAVLTQAQDQPFEPHRPFTGVPFLIKELVLQAQGVPSRAGSRATPNVPSPADSNLMQRFRGAGLQLVGTTQTPEMGYNATTETVAFGPVHNPWGAGHSAGGSSGGSGAAVAAGLVPLAHANDGGGSIRVPASCDGLVGLKPTRDRTPTGPGAADPLFGHALEFAVTRSVRASAALRACVAGPDLGAPHIIAAPQTSFAAAAAAPTPRLRIGVISDSYLGQPIHDECRQAVTRATQELQNLGHEVSECTFRLDFDEFAQHINVIWCIFAAQFVDQVCTGMGCAADNDHFEAVTLTCAEAGRQASALELLNAMDYVNRITRETAAVFADVDMLMSSTLSAPPPRHGELNQNDAGISAIDWTRQTFKYATNTPLFNSTGQPAISLPLHWSADGLPVGVQFAAGMGEEGALLNLATQLEEVYRWREQQARLFS